MHRYLRAIGFSNKKRKEIQELIIDGIRKADRRAYTISQDETMIAEYCRDYAEGMGITAAGSFDDDDKFHLDYYFPYLNGTGVSSYEDISVEKHAADDSYAGICDDLKVGISVIFYLQNKIPYVKAQAMGRLPIKGTSVTFSGLSVQGSIILPIFKFPGDDEKINKESADRASLLAAAKNGDEEAIETLTVEDMDAYCSISKRVQNEDVYSIVSTSLMPYGVECDQYSIIAEIKDVKKITNHITEEQMYVLTLFCNELTFDVSINIMDLVGEPMVGRRFKGVVWLQGRINFPEEVF